MNLHVCLLIVISLFALKSNTQSITNIKRCYQIYSYYQQRLRTYSNTYQSKVRALQNVLNKQQITFRTVVPKLIPLGEDSFEKIQKEMIVAIKEHNFKKTEPVTTPIRQQTTTTQRNTRNNRNILSPCPDALSVLSTLTDIPVGTEAFYAGVTHPNQANSGVINMCRECRYDIVMPIESFSPNIHRHIVCTQPKCLHGAGVCAQKIASTKVFELVGNGESDWVSKRYQFNKGCCCQLREDFMWWNGDY